MPVVHNRGKRMGDKTVARKIVFPHGWDAAGAPLRGEDHKLIEDSINAGEHKDITTEQLTHLKAMFPDEIINIEDIKDMQAQFKAAEPDKARAGYVAPEDLDAIVAARVAEELAKRELNKVDGADIKNMDRADLISLIEKEKLGIEHGKFKAPGTLAAAVAVAMENKTAAKSEVAA